MPRLGFACQWDEDAPATWSHIPWNFRAALVEAGELVDVGVELPGWLRSTLRVTHVRRWHGRWRSSWNQSRALAELDARIIERRAAAAGADAVLQVLDMAVVRRPYLVFIDLSMDLLLDYWEHGAAPYLPEVPRRVVQQFRDRQNRILESAAGVLAMSHWLARHLRDHTIDGARVHTVHPGVNTPPPTAPPRRRWERERRKLLFVGKVFRPKGGDLVVEAVKLLRARHVDVSVTVVGPRQWPYPEPPPPGVDFRGRLPLASVGPLYDEHDLFLMPSRFEALGIVFAEALARGLPCVARNACAMPELVEPGRNGALVDSDDPEELADKIVDCLNDESLYRRTWDEAASAAAYYSWDRAARQVFELVDRLS
ncbi:MAG TPA: glycosyltransferase family 4 protein [Acidimicrobiales bacterium]|nr:glycosyltransferase family 4 protein [Acidimicrobiales bacterium]